MTESSTQYSISRQSPLVFLLEAELIRLQPVDLIEFGRKMGEPVLRDERFGIDYLPGYHPDD